MLAFRRIGWAVVAWLVAVSALHLTLNVDWATVLNSRQPKAKRKFNVAYIPVT